jgi:hypothetical protein
MDIYEQCKTQANRVTQLKIDVVLEQLSKKDADSLRKALLDETIPSRGIERVLIDNNIDCGKFAINRWRQKNNVKTFTTSQPRTTK